MFRICDSLDKSLFNSLSSIVEQEVNSSTVNIQNNFMFGHNTIHVALNGIDDEASKLRRVALTEAFFADLRNLGKVVLVFDAFNLCIDPITKAWIAGDFLHRICQTPNVVVVIAGQEVPQPTLEWENVCFEHELLPIKREHWYEYAQKIGAVVPSHDSIDALYDYLDGHSLAMAEALARLYIPQERS